MSASPAGYEFLTPATVGDYLRSRPGLAGRLDLDLDDIANVEEVGDGNLNLVFIVQDHQGRGVVLKQALPYVRLVGPDWPMTPERARHEADALRVHAASVADAVPRLYDFDPARYVIVMEDLSDHRVWRGALNEGLRHDGVAEAMGRYVAGYAFSTSVLGLDAEAHKAAMVAASNPELCRITEDLVFTEPYADIGRNSVDPVNAPDAAELAADATMVAEIGRAKWLFMTAGEALIHGDLHTGSVMVRTDGTGVSARAIDPEFAFYGPVAFDLGALWGNYVLAAARAVALGERERAEWCVAQAPATWAAFEAAFRRRWPQRQSPAVFDDGFADDLLARWRAEAWLFGAAKMARRIVGLAKVSDIETLPPGPKQGAVRGALRAARRAVRERHGDPSAERFAAVMLAVLIEHATP